ncbi:MAG: CotH kinase family protein [Treponema sp.]|nr:CotH kinase family protein [Treponema sp.]
MNKICRSIFCFLTGLIVLSCSSLPKDEKQVWQKSSDRLYEICIQSDGIHVKTNASAKLRNPVFHVQKIELKNQKTTVESEDSLVEMHLSSTGKESVYPFVKKSQSYKVFITYSQNGTKQSAKSLNVVAAGGSGEYVFSAVTNKNYYNSEKMELSFEKLENTSKGKIENPHFSGNITGIKDKTPVYFDNIELKNKKLVLRPFMWKIKNKSFKLDLTYSFKYNGEDFFKSINTGKNETYIDNNAKIDVSKTGLPVIYLSTDTGKPIVSRDRYVKGKIKIGNKTYTTEIKGRGNTSWGQMPKHSMNIKLEKKASLLGMSESKKWVLVCNYGDKTLLRNQYMTYLGEKVFNRLQWSPHYKQVHVYINDKYDGVYLFGERIDVAKNRIVTGDKGFLVEMNRREDEPFSFRTDHDVSICLKDPKIADRTEQARIRKIFRDAENALFGKNFTDPKTGWRAYFDETSFIDWYLLHEYSKNIDSAWFSSIYLYYNSNDGKIHMGCLWDYDLGFGNVTDNNCNIPTGFYIRDKNVWYKQMFKDPEFVKKVVARWNSKKGAVLNSINKQIPKFYLDIREASYYNTYKWPTFGENTWREAPGYEKRMTLESEIKYFSDWCIQRYQWMDKSLNNLL